MNSQVYYRKKFEDIKRENRDQSFLFLDGKKSIIFSAPHAVEQSRDGKIKLAEPETATLSLMFNELGYPCIIKLNHFNDDANRDIPSTYKDKIIDYIKKNNIKCLIDLHQMAPFRAEEICFCLGSDDLPKLAGNTKLLKVMQTAFENNGFKTTVNDPIRGDDPGTVTMYVLNQTDIPCIEIEINSNLLFSNENKPVKTEKILNSLKEICKSFEE